MGKKKERGRPSEYDPVWHCEKARWAAFLGYTNKEIARMFGIDESTFYDWVKKYPEINQAMWHGQNTDMEALTKSVTKRATGFTYREKKQTWEPAKTVVEMRPDPNDPDKLIETEVHYPKRLVEEVITEKTLPPDVGAGRFALTNRQPDRWRESAHIDHTTNGKDLHADKLDLSLLTDDELETLARLEAKAMKK